jgi:site-specific recombinase XerD
MPLKKGKSKKTVSRNIRELHKGKTFARTKRKSGTRKANKQAVAIALNTARKSKTKRKSPARRK